MNTNSMKIKIFSHESDIDGLGNIILGKLAFGEIEYELFRDPQHLQECFKTYIEKCSLDRYDKIFITDLALYYPALSMVNEDEKLKNKVLVFDHHKGAIDAKCNIYDFTKVSVYNESGQKTCGTELFYEYLCQNGYLQKSTALDSWVELTRLEDTWEWTQKGEFGMMAHDLAILFNALTKEEYILKMIEKMKSSKTEFQYNEYEKQIIAKKKEECHEAIEKALQEMEYFIDKFGNKFAAVFTQYQFRNEIPEYIRNIGNPNSIKYVIIVALDKGENGQKSYRLIEDGFDVNEIAKLHGGGGHVAAAAVAINARQKEKAMTLSKRNSLEYLVNCIYEED